MKNQDEVFWNSLRSNFIAHVSMNYDQALDAFTFAIDYDMAAVAYAGLGDGFES